MSSTAARLVRDYKRVQVPYQLEIMRGVTTLGKETYIDAIYSTKFCSQMTLNGRIIAPIYVLLIQSNLRLRTLISEERNEMEDGDSKPGRRLWIMRV